MSEVVALCPPAGCVNGSAIVTAELVIVHAFPFCVVVMPAPAEKVVEATHDGNPDAMERTVPSVPFVSRDHALIAEPYKRSPEATAVCPVPPYVALTEDVPMMVPLASVVRTVDGIF